MIMLVSGSGKNSAGYTPDCVGQLIVPNDGNLLQEGRVWGADNGAYSGLDAHAFLRMVRRLEFDDLCKFVAVPDHVADHDRTLASFYRWYPVLRGLPLAFVLQDGCTASRVPWSKVTSVFVGGSTEFKLSEDVADCVQFAMQSSRWVHWGRVNTLRRLRHCLSVGGDSFDGSRFSRWPSEIGLGVKWTRIARQEKTLF